jgi:hypothetical protein
MRYVLSALLLSLLVPRPAYAVHELGLNDHLDSTVGPNITHDAGLRWVRIDLNWSLFQPADATPDFTVADAVVNAAVAKNLKVLAVIGYTPPWASVGNGDGMGTDNDIPVAGKYELFVTAAVNHFKDRVTYYELWNEPNLGGFFEGTTQQYIDLILKPGADAVHGACPTCKVVSGGLSSLASSSYGDWLDKMLQQAKDKIDVVNGHIYASFTEDSSGAGTTSDSFLNRLESHRIVKLGSVVVYESPNLSFKEVMDKNGVTKPFWLTETGTEAALGDATALDAQKKFYRRVLEKAATRPWWTTTIFYEAFDVQVSPTYHFGIAQDAGSGTYTKKPVFDFLVQAVQGLAFGGINPECGDALDNDGDGNIDFPADTNCLGPSAPSEGVAVVPDGGTVSVDGFDPMVDASLGAADGMSTGSTGGGDTTRPQSSGCSFGDTGELPLALVILMAIAVLASRRRA